MPHIKYNCKALVMNGINITINEYMTNTVNYYNKNRQV